MTIATRFPTQTSQKLSLSFSRFLSEVSEDGKRQIEEFNTLYYSGEDVSHHPLIRINPKAR